MTVKYMYLLLPTLLAVVPSRELIYTKPCTDCL